MNVSTQPMTTKVVAIHQPNFFPWLGYFDKIARADVFILLDDVQFPKTGGGWSNRVKMLIGGDANWVTAAIDRNFSGTRNINEMHYLSNIPWRDKIRKTVELNYKKHPFYTETMEWFEPLLINEESNIALYNMALIHNIVERLGLGVEKLLRSSDLTATGHSNELLCSLTKGVGGSVYMCGGGADGYQEEAVFTAHGLQLQYQSFQHPVYAQKGTAEFKAGLSIIDAFMNVGTAAVSQMLLNRA